jgi:nicotinamidase-related amidase
MPLNIDPRRTAVLSMDYHNSIVHIYVKDSGLMERAGSVLRRARTSGLTVIHVRINFRANLPELSSRNFVFGAIKGNPQHQAIFQGKAGELHSAVAPEGDEVIIGKSRISAFTGTDLELVLRSQEIDTLVLLGIATSGVVLSTLLEATDSDYRLVVVTDCCADLDQDLHTCLVENFFPKRATAVTAAEFVAALGG